jgi:hypothetical protein
MKRAALLILVASLVPVALAASTLEQVRITTEDAVSVADQLERAGFDVLEGSVTGSTIDVIVSPTERGLLSDMGYAFETLAIGRPFNEIQAERQAALAGEGGDPGALDVPPGYPNFIQVIDQLATAAAVYPSICQFVDLTTTYGMPVTHDGNHIYALKISDNVAVEEDEPAFLMVSNHHAREIVTPVLALYAMDQLTAGYGTDPLITNLVDDNEIWIAPVWNPDGYVYVFEVNNMWRKNRMPYGGDVGVDLNRNYPQGWDGPCAGSTSSWSETYKGPSPASEVETQTMMAWSLDQRFAKVIDYHSSGREVLHGYACWSYPFDSYLQSEAIQISQAASYGGDHRSPSAEGEHYEWQFGKQGAYAFLMETATQFQPSYSSAQSEAAMVWPSTLWMLDRPIPLWGRVTDAVTGEGIEASISYEGISFQHDETNTSGGEHGRYHAFLSNGIYGVIFEADGYHTQVLPVTIDINSSLQLDVALVPETAGVTLVGVAEEAGLKLLAANPARRSLRYEIGQPSQVSLKVFDVRGAFVRALVDGSQQPGRYEVIWDGRNTAGRRVAAGSYFYELRGAEERVSGKMLIVR